MKFFTSLLSVLSLAACKSILLSNDDSWVSSEIRALYRELVADGHDVIMVAPASQMSSQGGAFIVPDSSDLDSDGNFGYVSAGDPAWGQDPDDPHIWYFGGSPSACISFAFEYLLPKSYSNVTIDLVVSGVNQGPNISPGYYTASGTISAAYSGIYRGYPAISFGGSNLNNSFFQDSSANDEYDPANIYAKKAVEIIDLLVDADLPSTVGINVNFPEVGYLLDNETECTDPVWKFGTMMNGGYFAPIVKYDSSSDTFSSSYKLFKDSTCNDGSGCNLPSEYDIFWARNCTTSVTGFQVDVSLPGSMDTTVKGIFDGLF